MALPSLSDISHKADLPGNYGVALQLYNMGFTVIPIPYKGKKAKMPWKNYQSLRPEWSECNGWFLVKEKINFAIITGFVSKLVVVDADTEAAVLWVENNLPYTPLVVSTGKGRHYYYQHPCDGSTVHNRAKVGDGGVDVRGDGGYVIAPGSFHQNGHKYEFVLDPQFNGTPPRIEQCPVFNPAWVSKQDYTKSELLYFAEKELEQAVFSVRNAVKGQRNDTLNKASYACGMLVGGQYLPESVAKHRLLDAAVQSGLTHVEAIQTIQSGIDSGIQNPKKPWVKKQTENIQDLKKSVVHAQISLPDHERQPAFDIVLDIALSQFKWRAGNKAYSDQRGRLLTANEFKDSYTPETLGILLEQSVEATKLAALKTGKKDGALMGIWRAWAPSAFTHALDQLPTRGDNLTVEEEADLNATMKKLISREIRVSSNPSEIPIHTSILDMALESEAEAWNQVGHFPAYVRSPARIAIRYELFASGKAGDRALTSVSRPTLYKLLEKKCIGKKRVIWADGKATRAIELEKEWLAETFDWNVHTGEGMEDAPQEHSA